VRPLAVEISVTASYSISAMEKPSVNCASASITGFDNLKLDMICGFVD